MRTLFYFILLFIGCRASVHAQQVPCFYHHNGHFKIIDSTHNSIILIERKDSIEIQYLYKGDTSQYDMKLVFKVEWLNDCTYKQYLVYNILHTRKGDKRLPTDKRIITNKIMEADKNSYLVYTEFVSKNNVRYANRLWRIQ